ncbi:kinase-like domain-containing protein [Cantharellus anzutake]|uniref:kinase-like domain-containing protein n=1 Tax=Cantharellus anzutake TaxID=1750568 RepID=UPI00190367DC|nr:kinase-like domain-containing protein [Cantharellus anzutake]KAF8317504.1 kinase-like domain-containing protein [Cantharellus anzutake]
MSPDEVESLRRTIVQKLEQVDDRNLDGIIDIGTIQRTPKQGSFGVIYKGTKVCIKAFKDIESDVSRPEFLRRLVREMKVWCELAHTHVVQLHGWISYLESKQNLCPSLVSNWCGEGDVEAFLRRCPEADRRALVCGIAHGLEYLHSKEIVHADMKPQNVVVSDERTPQLCDFGLSFIIWDTSTHINPSSLAGTLRYIAPEVCHKEEPFRDKRTDVWAFGCTAMEILRNTRPYGTIKNEFAVHGAIGGSVPPFALPAAQPIEEILLLCLEPTPEHRINMQTVTERLGQNHSGGGQADNSSATQSFSHSHQFLNTAILSST